MVDEGSGFDSGRRHGFMSGCVFVLPFWIVVAAAVVWLVWLR